MNNLKVEFDKFNKEGKPISVSFHVEGTPELIENILGLITDNVMCKSDFNPKRKR